MTVCELDSVPGGIGYTAWMAAHYASFGHPILGGADGLVAGFATAIRHVAGVPVSDEARRIRCAIVVSEESAAYRDENTYLAERLSVFGIDARAVAPEALRFSADGAVGIAPLDGGDPLRVDVVYRFFELFDLPHVANAALLWEAARLGRVAVTPPFKAHLEEKLLFALYHHPDLARFWDAALPAKTRMVLDAVLPETWVLDPAPTRALGPALAVSGTVVVDFRQLAATTGKTRGYVVKPSGFSPLAWGSRGVVFGGALSAKPWAAALKGALDAFATTPHILQRYRKPADTIAAYVDFSRDRIVEIPARARFSPYYFVAGGTAAFSGMMVTLCPLGRWALHGMSDAVVVPASAPSAFV